MSLVHGILTPMKLKDILACVDGKLVCGESHLEDEVMRGFASDLMSDVLTILEDDIILITGLSNNQAIRTAEMSDISNILLVRNKKPSQSMIDMAKELNISLAYTSFSLFKASGLLYQQGLKPVY
ncbi:hypothetical protein SpiBuddy_2295 [Sphaerochaeta globosa str. Buddy]|uniref:DRTGG domain-containing protein n=2 Tax=Sphaerochaeta TaxID=399320 RepID=F0RSK0_SPHGB|nr:hypothetical protein SpiBuddy_2295 [Sphaerochaeta globosa str. Buddy]